MHDPVGKLLSLVVGGAITAGSLWFGREAWHDYVTFDDAPKRLGLADAVQLSAHDRQWVTIESRGWRCDQLLRDVPGGAAFVPASTLDGSIVVARFDHEIACRSVVAGSLTGVVEPMAPSRASDLGAAGLALPELARLRTFDVCAHCGRDNSRLGVVICALFAVVGVTLYPIRRALLGIVDRWRFSVRSAIVATGAEEAAADRRLRMHGALVAACGVAAFVFGEGRLLWQIVPMPMLGAIVGVFGTWVAVFPAAYRRLARRGVSS